MKVLGLITEYNPFHNGHAYHLKSSIDLTGATHTIAVMSGNFIQRGEISLIDKWIRAKAAVECGVNLVIELPLLCAVSSAESFAYGAVKLLDSAEIVDCLVFGSESGDIDKLKADARVLMELENSGIHHLKSIMREGISYSAAVENVAQTLHNHKLERKSNDILGIEYLKALNRIGSKIKPMCIERLHTDYHSKEEKSGFASATHIRALMLQNKPVEHLVPSNSFKLISKQKPVDNEKLYQMLRYRILSENAASLAKYRYVDEGLENLIVNNISKFGTFEDFAMSLKSKRYPLTRIKRMLISILLGISKDDAGASVSEPACIRVLAFDEKGRELLSAMKKRATLPIVTNKNKFYAENHEQSREMQLELLADHISSMARGEDLQNNYYKAPEMIKR